MTWEPVDESKYSAVEGSDPSVIFKRKTPETVSTQRRYKIICTGWDCAGWIEQTLASIEMQDLENWDVCIVDDATEDPRQAEIIRNWCDSRDDRWHYIINNKRHYAMHNQVMAIKELNPNPQDVIVWLDLDGDQFAHSKVLNRLEYEYDTGARLTYGQFRPVPDPGPSCHRAQPYPDDVRRTSNYRFYTRWVYCGFNHLRTMEYSIFSQIPEDQFKWPDGRWYEGGNDYVVMMPGLELSMGRDRFVDEVLVLYNHDNPNADYLVNSKKTSAVVLDALARPNILDVLGLTFDGELF